MEKIKKFKNPIIVASVIFVIVCAFAVTSEVTALRINDIENYEDIFTDVEKIQYYDGSDNFFTSVSPEKRLRAINKIKIESEPVSAEISDDRSYGYRLVFDENYTVYISEDFSELWIDDANTDEDKNPSHTYAVRNPGALKKLFN